MNEDIKKSLILIRQDDDKKTFLGMGFVIFSNMKGTYILTAAHVLIGEGESSENKLLNIEGSTKVKIICQGNTSLNDIAVIFMKDLINYKPVKLYNNKELVSVGRRYNLVGTSFYSDGEFNREAEVKGIITEHNVQSISNKNQKITVYEIKTEHTNEIDKGYSGTAVFLDDTMIVIGILSKKRKSSKLAYVIPIQQLKEVWNNKKNWENKDEWYELPFEWFSDYKFSTNISSFLSSYQPKKILFNKRRKILTVLGIIGILFFLNNLWITEKSESLNSLGENAYHSKNHKLAINYYNDALNLTPDNYKVYSNLGLAYEKNGELELAIEINNKAIALARENNDKQWEANSYFNNAQIYKKQKQWKKALESYTNALSKKENAVYRKGIREMEKK